ncbi:uncharacterized protein LOC131657723 [Vicia villosa]|uniref:uncharacterized protein LOC131657723 n=1 Tax=Vicia villosa TaxID=3911 RepID=UPI00273C5140|nr:uncharacterized protein LOC131657723 [Vicia villosa]
MKAMFKHKDLLLHSAAWNQCIVTGVYSTRLLYNELRGERTCVLWRNLIRGNRASPRAIFLLWMACQKRLQTKDRLKKIGVISDGNCLFCGDPESRDHLFFDCRITNQLWHQVLSWMKISHRPQGWHHELRWIISMANGKSNRAKLVRISIAEAIYHVWTVRNMKVFQPSNGGQLRLQEIKDRIIRRSQSDRKLLLFVNDL